MRPIVLFTMFYRVWSRARRDMVRDWETTNPRSYWWGVAGRSTERCMWEHAALDEGTKGLSVAAVSLLLDLVKCYDLVSHPAVLAQAIALNFPLAVLRLSLAAYGAHRRITLRGAVSREVQAMRGVAAGCGQATTLLKVLLMQLLDNLSERHPAVQIRVVVDDISGQVIERPPKAARAMVAFTKDLYTGLETDLGMEVSRTKTAVLSSSPLLGKLVLRGMRSLGMQLKVHVRQLGVDYNAGRRRCTKIAAGRVKKVVQSAPRFKMLRRAGAGVAGLLRTGAIPRMVYGASVQGISTTQLKAMRKVAGGLISDAKGGRSLASGWRP